ncbi:hypothetical protein J7J58_00410 [candidate division WOR-3 bacterium]|nr:hypothetical protein [candidate division WOR-3 bacterium]
MVDLLKNDWIIKLLSLLVAIGIWFNAKTDQTSYYTIEAKINIRNFPKQYILAKKLPDKIDIKIYGKIKDIIVTKFITTPTVYIDGNILKKGENMVYIEKSNVTLPKPDKMKIVKITPSYLTIELDKKVKKEVGVVPYVTGIPKEGYVNSGGIRVIPDKVTLFGPEKLLGEIKYVKTEEIDISGQGKTVDCYSKIILPESINVYSNIDSVRVIIPIAQLITKRLDSVKVYSKVTKYKVMGINPQYISMTLSGSNYMIDSLVKFGINAYVVVNVNAPGEYLLPVFVNLPDNVYKQEINPEFVTVKVVR